MEKEEVKYWVHHESESLLKTYGDTEESRYYKNSIEVLEINENMYKKLKELGYTE